MQALDYFINLNYLQWDANAALEMITALSAKPSVLGKEVKLKISAFVFHNFFRLPTTPLWSHTSVTHTNRELVIVHSLKWPKMISKIWDMWIIRNFPTTWLLWIAHAGECLTFTIWSNNKIQKKVMIKTLI